MPLPESLQMPSLTALPLNSGTLILNIAVAGGGPSDDMLRRHFVNFIRLVDLCVKEYEQARRFLEKSLPGNVNRLLDFLSAIDHLELTVITMRRALKAFQALAHHKDSPPISRETRKSLEAFEGPLKDVRDSVIHIEELISRGELEEGDSHALVVDKAGANAEVGKEAISLIRLCVAIRKLHKVASELSHYREV